ncbi:hypothetical protein GGF31_001118 [Allomyces arbusculus]|nr:hypothetical protein GGF31_001118 [Allomyces arbusculus]
MAPNPPTPTPAQLRAALDATAGALRLRRPADTVAALVHAALTLVGGWTLIGTGDADPAPSTSQLPNLPADFNPAGASTYTLHYRVGGGSGARALVRVVVMGATLVVHALRPRSDAVAQLDVDVREMSVGEAMYPVAPGDRPASSMLKASDAQLAELIDQVRARLVGNVAGEEGRIPPGAESPTPTVPPARILEESLPAPPNPMNRPAPPPEPHYPDPFGGAVHPASVGHRDLDPLGGVPPMGPYPFGGGAHGRGPMGPFGGPGPMPFGPGGDGGGSIMGPGHPLFAGPSGSGGGPWGGDRFLPPGAVPPGARFDPIGPQVPPGGGPGGFRPPFQGAGRGRGRGSAGPFSGEPDPDELPPPGYSDMFM